MTVFLLNDYHGDAHSMDPPTQPLIYHPPASTPRRDYRTTRPDATRLSRANFCSPRASVRARRASERLLVSEPFCNRILAPRQGGDNQGVGNPIIHPSIYLFHLRDREAVLREPSQQPGSTSQLLLASFRGEAGGSAAH